MPDFESRWRTAARDAHLADKALQQLTGMALYPLVPVGAAPPAGLSEYRKGSVAVPCYLSEAAARHAAQGRARVVRASGREFLESLDDRYLWLDPHSVGLFLSPGDVRELLESTPVPPAIATDRTLADWSAGNDLPANLRATWVDVLRQFPAARRAYWLGRATSQESNVRRLVVVTAPEEDLPRLMQAMVNALRDIYAGPLTIEAQAMIEGQLPEAEARLHTISTFYDQAG